MPRHVRGLTIYIGDEGAIYYRGATRFSGTSVEGGDLIALEIPADAAAQEAAGSPYLLGIDTGTLVPFWSATPAAGTGVAPVTVSDGAGGFLIVFDSAGNVVYA